MSENKDVKYKVEYAKEHYKTISLTIPKDDAEFVKQVALDHGYKSTTRFIVDAINEKIARY